MILLFGHVWYEPVVRFVLLQWCTLPMLNGSSPTETCQSNSTSGVMSWSVSSYSRTRTFFIHNSHLYILNTSLQAHRRKSAQRKHPEVFFSLLTSFCPSLLPPEMGVQTPPALPEDKRVLVAGGTYSLCHKRGGSWGGNSPGNAALQLPQVLLYPLCLMKYTKKTTFDALMLRWLMVQHIYSTRIKLCLTKSLCALCICRCFRSWICMPGCTRSWWRSPWWRGGRPRRRSLQEEITPPLWRHSSLPAAEPFRYRSVLDHFDPLIRSHWCQQNITFIS